MQDLPIYISLFFLATTAFAMWLFYKAANQSKTFMAVLLGWTILQSALAIAGFYSNPSTMTARFPLLIVPPILFLVSRFTSKAGRKFLDGLKLPMLTLFHIIRVPVELVLFWLFINHTIPRAMTFEGRNFDMLSGISAPVIYYFGFIQKKLGKSFIIAWNFICLALLLNVVSAATLSLPARFTQFGFEQPAVALGYFPFILLPAVLVPLVLLSTLAAVKQLLNKPE